MPEIGLDARLRFLNRSARLLDGIAPATSAHLMLERNNVAEVSGRTSNKAQMHDFCQACGTIFHTDLMPGPDSLDPGVAELQGRNTVPDNVSLGNHGDTQCHACRRVVVRPSLRPRQYERNDQMKVKAWGRPSEAIIIPPSELNMAESVKVTSANINSKKRAKARKEGGLQAMLEKAKGTNSQYSSTGLNLMDLMKEG